MKRPWLLPLVPLYAAALWTKRRFLEAPPKHLRHPVLSIGSLSAGGAGKTPVVLALADLLTRAGYPIDVLTRGYGRTRTSPERVERVDPTGTAEAFGDEPLLLARAGLPVWVAADRHQAGLLAESAAPEKTIHLLDDGFQHRRLARNLNLVLLTQTDAEDCLLPAGNLREPLTRLRAADAIIVREEEAATLANLLHQKAPTIPIWLIRRRLLPLQTQEKLLAFCSIARPENFFAMLADTHADITGTIAFPDHHRFTPRDIDRLLTRAKRTAAIGFLTTEKDATRLTDAMQTRLQAIGPVWTASLNVTFVDEEAVLRQVVASISP